YQVNENLEDFDERPLIGFRPQNAGPYGPNSRPIVPASYPGNKGVLVGPGGPTGIIKRYSYLPAVFRPSKYIFDARVLDVDWLCPTKGLHFYEKRPNVGILS
ncbi:hypothetical protein WH47_10706, partial [Habropoda laboriosa]